MKSNDPASLQNLNDIVLPANVDWWPLANGWYFLLGMLVIAIAWYSYRATQRWFANRYRRAALQELDLLRGAINNNDDRDTWLRQLPVLLKRTALSAYPRHQVASLSGKDWFDFLNSTLSKPVFNDSTTITLEQLSYSSDSLSAIESPVTSELINAIAQWIKHHVSATRLNSKGVN